MQTPVKNDGKPKGYTDEQLRRLWEYGLHEDNVFNDRYNFFLIFQSVLFGVAGALLSQAEPRILLIQLLACFGILLSGIWAYVQGKQKFIISDLSREVKEHFDEYAAAYERRSRPLHWRISTTWLLAYAVPMSTAALWIVFVVLLESGLLK